MAENKLKQQRSWSKLKVVHTEKSEQSAKVLLQKFMSIKMGDNELIVDFASSVIGKVLSSLPIKFDHLRSPWYAEPRDQQSIEQLTGHLVNEENLMSSPINGKDNNKNSPNVTTMCRKARAITA